MNERGHLSSETIDLMMLAALSEPEHVRAKEHLVGCGSCRSLMDETAEDFQRFSQYVLPRTLPAIEERAKAGWKPRWWKRLPLPALGLLTATVLAVVVWPRAASDEVYIGERGGAGRVQVVADRAGAQFRVGAGTHVRPGDRLRFLVDPGPSRYVIIASRDGAGRITVYYPFEGTQSVPLQAGRQELPGSIELDDVTGTEKLVAVFSRTALPADAVRRALSEGGSGEVPAVPGAEEQVAWEIIKDPP